MGIDWKKWWPMAAVLVVAILSVVVWMARGSKPQIIVKEGQEYRILSFAEARTCVDSVGTAEALTVSTYVITFTYVGKAGNQRGTIAVPKRFLVRDKMLRANRVIWDRPFRLEGMEYRQVRWNPAYTIRSIDQPVLQEQPPFKPPQ